MKDDIEPEEKSTPQGTAEMRHEDGVPLKFLVGAPDFESGDYRMGLMQTIGDSKYIAQPIIMQRYDRYAYTGQAMLQLSKQELQQLFNRLYEIGFRPQDGSGNAGHIESIKYHLEDMRKLVFKSE